MLNVNSNVQIQLTEKYHVIKAISQFQAFDASLIERMKNTSGYLVLVFWNGL